MRVLSAMIALSAISIGAFAQSTTTIPKSTTSIKRSVKSPFSLKLEMETSSVRDNNNEVQGNYTYYQFLPGYHLTKKLSVQTGLQYATREAGGTLKGQEKANKDHLETAFFKLRYNPTKFKDNGIADLRLQFRLYSDQDDFFKRRYGSDGNYQLRAYFGRPIAGGWSINKYVSYLRYKNYFNNSSAGKYTRDYELRARISPTFKATDNLDLGITGTYNHIFKVQKLEDEEKIDLDLTARYAYYQYAAMIRVGAPYMTNEGGTGTLKRNEEAGKNIGYALTLTAFL